MKTCAGTMRTLAVALGVVAAGVGSASEAQAATIPSAFFISKSENKNQVHYSIDVDESCKPAGAAPVRAYWRDLEKGPNVTSALKSHEELAYGIKYQKVVSKDGGRKIVELAVRGLPSRVVHIETRQVGDKCVAETRAVVKDESVTLLEVFLKIGFLGVDYARFIGRSAKGIIMEDVRR